MYVLEEGDFRKPGEEWSGFTLTAKPVPPALKKAGSLLAALRTINVHLVVSPDW